MNFYYKKGFCVKIVVIVIALFVFVAAVLFYFLKQTSIGDLLNNSFVQDHVIKKLENTDNDLFAAVPELLGFNEPRTYVILFLNNTELRPGGGFIGSYATIRMDKGKMELLALEGSETLDARAPASWKVVPPQIIADHLNVDRWYFRDANWSPDFAMSAAKVLEFYSAEGGVAYDHIDAVIGVTTHVLEDILSITGPVSIDGMSFSAEDVIEKLEYEVEYAYVDRGLAFSERKNILKPFMLAVMDTIKDTLFTHFDEYEPVIKKLIAEKHIMLYSSNESLAALARAHAMTGRMDDTEGDYILWADANLAALKTDHAIKRELRYTISREPVASQSDETWYVGTVAMTYRHMGTFDWRTTRYRTYARVFVPMGSRLISSTGSMKWDRSDEGGVVDQGIENGRQWFGAFIAIEPGQTGTLSFSYALAPSIQKQIYDGSYSLFVQKQLGSTDHGLTLDLNFATTISTAQPAEDKTEWGDGIYRMKSDLRVDRMFEIKL